MNKKNIKELDLISINTQGTEFDILKGFSSALSEERIKAVKVEIDFMTRYETHYANSQLASITGLLAEHGFDLFDILAIKNSTPAGIAMLVPLFVHKSVNVDRCTTRT